MVQAVSFENPGGIEVLKVIDVAVSPPADEEVTVKHIACEVNFLDVYHRKGIYPLDANPKIPGVSAVGYIEKLGKNVKGFREGDRVGYVCKFGGGYSVKRNINQSVIFSIPEQIPDYIAAASIVKGLTAHYLCKETFIVKPGVAVLIHAAAGGVGQILARWCNMLGALVIGTVGSEEKKGIALKAGCHKVINYQTENWVEKVLKYTNSIGVNCVYDSVGQATFSSSLECLMKIGILVSYGASSGSIQPFDIGLLSGKSLFFTKPSLFDYKENRLNLVLSAGELFENIKEELLVINEPTRFPLIEAAKAHSDLESRKTTGSSILIP
jgi:NADPH:quinone reductase